ncbi:unnamed protein product [Ectocarpus sp. CCAP 1310/34]|nr:unnamed protein product [Ectocarpus sp. CCAP 1310/34]
MLKEELRELLCVVELGEAAATKANIRALVVFIETLKLHSHSNIGRAACNTVIAAAAGAEHTCDPDDPCTPNEPCAPAEPHGAVSLAARAQGLGVRDPTFRASRTRMHRTDQTIPPQEALEKERYLWAPRKERSDKMDERVMGLARRFWHSDENFRAPGDSGTKAMWRPSKKAGEEYHPRRQLMVAGDQV